MTRSAEAASLAAEIRDLQELLRRMHEHERPAVAMQRLARLQRDLELCERSKR
jgi:hypothetical protein